MTVTISESKLRTVVKINKRTSGSNPQYVCDCIFCGRKGKMYISVRTQLFDCKVCHEEGSIIKILRKAGRIDLLGQRTVTANEHIDSLKTLMTKKALEDTDVTLEKLPVVTMPVGFRTARSNAYLASRLIYDQDAKRYNIGTTQLVGRYVGYVLLPIYDAGQIKGFLGRYANKVVPDDKLRYINSKNIRFGELLYGYDDIVEGQTQTVIIVEGCFDKIRTDQNLQLDSSADIKCVATFGKKISPQQRKKLQLKGVHHIILSYDQDATEDIKRYALELRQYFYVQIAVCKNKGKRKRDLGDCTVEETLEVFSRLQDVDNFVNGSIRGIQR